MRKFWNIRYIKFQHIIIPVILFLLFISSNYYLNFYTGEVDVDQIPIIVSYADSDEFNTKYQEVLDEIHGISPLNQSLEQYLLYHTELFNTSDQQFEGNVIYTDNQIWDTYFSNFSSPLFYSDSIDFNKDIGSRIILEKENRTIDISSYTYLHELPENPYIRANTALIYPPSNISTINVIYGPWVMVIGSYLIQEYQHKSTEEIQDIVTSLHDQFQGILSRYANVSELESPYYEAKHLINNYAFEGILAIIDPIIILLIVIELAYAFIYSFSIQQLTTQYNLLFQRGMSHSKLRNSFIAWNMIWIVLPSIATTALIYISASEIVFQIFIRYMIGLAIFKISASIFLTLLNFRNLHLSTTTHISPNTHLMQNTSKHYLVKGLILGMIILSFYEGRNFVKRQNLELVKSWDIIILLDNSRFLDVLVLLGCLMGFAMWYTRILRTHLTFNRFVESYQKRILLNNFDILYVSIVILGYLNMIAVFIQNRWFKNGNTAPSSTIPQILPFNHYYLMVFLTTMLASMLFVTILIYSSGYTSTLELMKLKYNQKISLPSTISIASKALALFFAGSCAGICAGIIRGYQLSAYDLFSFLKSSSFVQFAVFSFISNIIGFFVVLILLYKSHIQFMRVSQ